MFRVPLGSCLLMRCCGSIWLILSLVTLYYSQKCEPNGRGMIRFYSSPQHLSYMGLVLLEGSQTKGLVFGRRTDFCHFSFVPFHFFMLYDLSKIGPYTMFEEAKHTYTKNIHTFMYYFNSTAPCSVTHCYSVKEHQNREKQSI